MSRKKVISLRLTEQEHENLDRLAKLRGVTVSDVIRQMINKPPTHFPYIQESVTTGSVTAGSASVTTLVMSNA